MSAARTLAALAAAGAALRVDGPRLVLVGPRTLPPELRADVRAHAAELRVLLAPAAPPVPADHQGEQPQDAGPAGCAPRPPQETLNTGQGRVEKHAKNQGAGSSAPPRSLENFQAREAPSLERPAGAGPLGYLDTVERDGLLVLGPIRGRAPLASPSAAVDPGRAAAWFEAYARRLGAGLDPESAARLTSTTHGPRPA